MQTSSSVSSRGRELTSTGSRTDNPRLPLARLLQLVMILQSERFPNARRLAEACAVSRRTIYRDLATLEAAGIDVLFQPARQGYQLSRDCWLQPAQLAEKEALALMILSRQYCCANAPEELRRNAASGLAKLVHALPAELRARVAAASELIADARIGCQRVSSETGGVIHEAIVRALSSRRRLALWHRRHEAESVEATKLGVYRLARVRDQPCLIGHSTADRGIRLFEVSRIDRLEPTDEVYAIPPRFRLERFLQGSRSGDSESRSEV